MKNKPLLSNEQIDRVIEMAWEDRTPFDAIFSQFGLNEKTEKYVDYFVKIKINKNLESLNISNSASIVFFHINKVKKNVD